jgi:hypothetical protein
VGSAGETRVSSCSADLPHHLLDEGGQNGSEVTGFPRHGCGQILPAAQALLEAAVQPVWLAVMDQMSALATLSSSNRIKMVVRIKSRGLSA